MAPHPGLPTTPGPRRPPAPAAQRCTTSTTDRTRSWRRSLPARGWRATAPSAPAPACPSLPARTDPHAGMRTMKSTLVPLLATAASLAVHPLAAEEQPRRVQIGELTAVPLSDLAPGNEHIDLHAKALL